MEMSPALTDAFNAQITLELESSQAYLQMSAYFEGQSLKGMAGWMRQQSEEERLHALKFLDFVVDRGNDVRLGTVDAPRSSYSSPLEVFEASLAQERRVSAAISDLHALATKEGDTSSFPLLQWFLEEQIEEESSVGEIVDQLRLIGADGGALLLLDREMGTRGSGSATAQ